LITSCSGFTNSLAQHHSTRLEASSGYDGIATGLANFLTQFVIANKLIISSMCRF